MDKAGLMRLKFVAVLGTGWLLLALALPVLAYLNQALIPGPSDEPALELLGEVKAVPAPPLRAWTVAADGEVFVLDADNIVYRLAPEDLTSLGQSSPLPLGTAPIDAPAYLLADTGHLFVGSQAVSQTLVLDRADFSQVAALPHAGPMALDPDRHLFIVSAQTSQLLAYNPADLDQLPQGIPVYCLPVNLAADPAGRRLYVQAVTSCGSSHHGESYYVYDLDTLAQVSRVGSGEGSYGSLLRPAVIEGVGLGAGVYFPYGGHPQLLAFDGQGRLLAKKELPLGEAALAAGGDWLYLRLRRGLAVLRVGDLSIQGFLPFTSTVPNDLALSPDGETVYLFGDRVSAYAAAGLRELGLALVSPFPPAWTQEMDQNEATQVRVYTSPDVAQDGVVFAQLLPAGNPFWAEVYRSDDGGTSWRSFPLDTGPATALSLSPDFASDRTLVTDFQRSTDGGESWSSWSPRLAFVSERAGNREIYTSDGLGADLQQLTDHPALDENPAWSPAWTRLAFQSNRSGNWDIFTLRADCGPTEAECDLRQLTDHPADDLLPAWSPDGRRIAFVSWRDGNPEIYVMDKDGQNQRRLTFYPGGDWRPAWLPDSQQLVFTSDRNGNNDIYLLAVPPEPASLTAEPPLMPIVTGPADDRDPAIGGSSPLASSFDFDFGPEGFLFFLSDRDGAMKSYVTLPVSPAPPASQFAQIDQVQAHPSWFEGTTLLAAVGEAGGSDIYNLTPWGPAQALIVSPGFDGQPAGGPVWWQPDEANSFAWLIGRWGATPPVVLTNTITPAGAAVTPPVPALPPTPPPALTPEPTPLPAVTTTASLNLQNLTPVGHLGGAMNVVSVQEEYAYLGMGPELAILDISNPAQPARVGYILLPQEVQDVEIRGHVAYIAAGESGLRVVDVSVPTKPVEIGFYETPDHISGLAVVDNRVYLAGGEGLRILDVSEPTAPVELGFCAITQVVSTDVVVRGDKAYVTTTSSTFFRGGLSIVDVSDPATPAEISRLNLSDLYAALEAGLVDDWVFIAGSGGLPIVDAADPARPAQSSLVVKRSDDQEVMVTGLDVAGHYLYLTDAGSGLHIADISDPTRPFEVGFIPLPQPANDVDVAAGYAYVVGGSGLHIFDVADPTAPTQAGQYLAPGGVVRQVAGQGDYIYVAANNTLNVVDVSHPALPVQAGRYTVPNEIRGVAVQANYLYLAEEDCKNGCQGKIHILDISNPVSLAEVSSYDPLGRASSIAVAGNYAYVSKEGLLIVDISNPAKPTQVAYAETLPGNVAAVAGDYAYAIGGKSGLHVIDISNPAAPTEVAVQPVSDEAWSAAVAGNYAYLGERTFGFHVIDISRPAAPLEVSAVEELGGKRLFSVEDMTVAGDRLYLTAGSDGLRVFDISRPARPAEIGFYQLPLSFAEDVVVRSGTVYVSYGSAGLYIFQAAR